MEQAYWDFSARAAFVGFFIPSDPDTCEVCAYISDHVKWPLEMAAGVPRGGRTGERTESKDLVFTGRVFLYHESILTLQQRAELDKLYRGKGLEVHFRDHDYWLFQRMARLQKK